MSALTPQWRVMSVCCLMLVLMVSGCSSSKSRVGGVLNLDTDLQLTFLVDSNTNPDENKNSSPVIVRLYELKSDTGFNRADFIDLYERDEELLGGDLVKKRVLHPMIPGEERAETIVLGKGTAHVALYAEFSQYRGSSHKVVFPVTQNNVIKNRVTIKISGNEMTLVER